MSLLEPPNQFPPFITGNEAGDTTGDIQVNRESRGEKAGQHNQVCRIIASSLQILDPMSEASGLIVGDPRALNHSVAFDEDLSERTMCQLEGIGSEVADTTANFRHHKLGKFIGQSKCLVLKTVMPEIELQLQYAAKGSDFPSLDSVKLVIVEHAAEGKRLTPDKDSPEIWLPIEL